MQQTTSVKKHVLEDCLKLKQAYYKEIAKATAEASNETAEINAIIKINEIYGSYLEQVATSILNDKALEANKVIIHNTIGEVSDTSVSIDYEILDYVLENKADLLKRKIIRQQKYSPDCLICGKYIKGLGIMDYNDAGSAICFNCIEQNEHYIGDGIYFTDFE